MGSARIKEAFGWWLPTYDTLFSHPNGLLGKEFGEYQVEVRQRSFEEARKRNCAIDIGAHVGLWAREMAYNFDKVIAFEPDSTNRECFFKNVKESNVTLHSYAIGNKTGQCSLKRHEDYNSGSGHVIEGHNIKIRTLDSFLIPNIDYIKIDVEEYEMKVLEGAKRTLNEFHPVVVIEIGDHVSDAKDSEPYKFLTNMGAKFITKYSRDCIFSWE
jgi:FkbM family methyltransferase